MLLEQILAAYNKRHSLHFFVGYVDPLTTSILVDERFRSLHRWQLGRHMSPCRAMHGRDAEQSIELRTQP